jgi:hypothetical protein
MEVASARLAVAADAVTAAHASLAEVVRAVALSSDASTWEDRECWEKVREIPAGGSIGGWSWTAEPAHAFFGESVFVWVTEDRGHEGERGAGGPFLSMEVVSVADAPDASLVSRLAAARQDYVDADLALQRTFVEVWRELESGLVRDSEQLAWLDEIPPGRSVGGRRWTAKATLDRAGHGWMTVSFVVDDDHPRLSRMVGMAQFRVG